MNGVAAGLSTKSDKIGFVAAKPIPSVLSNINSVLLGAKSVNPERDGAGDLHRRVVAAGARGGGDECAGRCRLRRHHLPCRRPEGGDRDGRRRAASKTCGHNASQAPLAPKGFVTGAEYKWETIYKIYADALAKGEPLPNFIVGGYDNDMLRNTPFGAGATPEAIKAAEAAIDGAEGQDADLYRAAQGQQGQCRPRSDHRQLRSGARRHELSARGRARLDNVTEEASMLDRPAATPRPAGAHRRAPGEVPRGAAPSVRGGKPGVGRMARRLPATDGFATSFRGDVQ